MVTIAERIRKCVRCGHEWIMKRNGPEPTTCPKCKSPYYNRPRKAETAQ